MEAQAGEIGGDVNHEFMAVAAVGEDDFVWCRSCDYAANVEAAVRGAPRPGAPDTADAAGSVPAMAPEHTPDLPGIKGVAEFLGVEPGRMLKCIAFDVDGEMGLALVPGDREVNPYALNRALPENQIAQFSINSAAAAKVVEQKAAGYNVLGNPRPAVTLYVSQHKINEGTFPSLAVLIQENVGRLQVAVADALGVDKGQGPANIREVAQGVSQG